MQRIEAFIARVLFRAPPSWGAVAVMLAVGISLVAFGNLDRIFWRMTAQGATLSGLVVDVRAYRLPETDMLTYVPKVAFRDPGGAIRIMEAQRGSVHYDLPAEHPVLVAWQPPAQTVAIDVPFERTRATSMIMSLVTALGLTSWLGGIWLLIRRVSGLRRVEPGAQVGQYE